MRSVLRGSSIGHIEKPGNGTPFIDFWKPICFDDFLIVFNVKKIYGCINKTLFTITAIQMSAANVNFPTITKKSI